ncbi:hypothetical protein GF373_03505 [bacterium]|nr:hypothetical protein [bacterium]
MDTQYARFGKLVEELLVNKKMDDLGPGKPNYSIQGRLRQLNPEDLFPNQNIKNKEMAKCCLSGLWLYHDFLDESHTISQQIPTRSGSYWHGIMHRREPDASNAKYWFRRVEEHPIFPDLLKKAKQIGGNYDKSPQFLKQNEKWDPFAYIDWVEETRDTQTPAAPLCQQIQQMEWILLFDYCYNRAIK